MAEWAIERNRLDLRVGISPHLARQSFVCPYLSPTCTLRITNDIVALRLDH